MNPFYNAHHSPVGAFATFTLGYPGARGGLGLERGAPADESVFIGAESRAEPGVYDALPFFDVAANEAARYDVEATTGDEVGPGRLRPFDRDVIERRLGIATDTWEAGDLTFRILSPAWPLPDPADGDEASLRQAILPAVRAELTVDNRDGTRSRAAFFGYQGADPYRAMRRLDETVDGLAGIGQGRHAAIAGDAAELVSGLAFTPEQVIAPDRPENLAFGLGPVGLLVGRVPPGERRTFRFAICFYREGTVTTGREARYLYTRCWGRIEDVAAEALETFGAAAEASEAHDAELEAADHLCADQRFMLAHAVHSYYGSTQLLEEGGAPLWVVNEGEYRMMNTFDLTVDMLFYEIKQNPWTVRNVLEQFIGRYRYEDRVRLPGDETEHPGGVSFTHDMGVANAFSRPAHSSYEQFGLDGCFSHMTCEQLVNWVLCASVYVEGGVEAGGDAAWARRRLPIFEACLESLVNRDHPDPDRRNGVMGADSSRTMGGAEITTYDSLDTSLGQARNNGYLAVKTWAAYVALEKRLADAGRTDGAALAAEQAQRAAATVVAQAGADGALPAVFETDNPGQASRIIPAIEGLVFPAHVGCPGATDPAGRFADLVAALRRHLEAVLEPGTCLFADGGWKISSTSDNSWLSKIYLSQHVARHVLGIDFGEAGARADRVHVGWLTDPELSWWAWSDQIVAGRITGSKYYPRGVTSVLWLDEGKAE